MEKILKSIKSPFFDINLINLGFGIIVLGLVIIIVSRYPGLENWMELGKYVVPIGLGLLSIGLALDSTEKMKSIANADFFALAYTFEDRAIPLYNGIPDPGERDTISWRLLNYFEQADKIKKWVDSDVQKRLIKELQYLIEKLQYALTSMVWVEFKNYRGACSIAIGFKVDEEVKNDLIYQLGYYIGYKNEGETNRQYLERKSRELASRERFDTFERVIEKI